MNLVLYRGCAFFCLMLAGATFAKRVDGHGVPIFVSVNSVTNQVEVSASFDDAVVDGSLTSDLPGFGVLNPFAGVDPKATISLRFPQDLLYTNSDVLEATVSSVTVVSAEFVQQTTIDSGSGFQEFLDWAVYPAAAGIGWDADGLYFLGPGTPAAGVYGVVTQVHLDGAIDSEPFLIPVVHSPTDLQSAKATLQEGIDSLPAADFTRDWRVDAADLGQWDTNYGLSQASHVAKVLGDADNDASVTGLDFLVWQTQVGTSPANQSTLFTVPEPSSLCLLWVATYAVGIRTRKQRRGRAVGIQ